jgi:hypothetical protein
MEPDPTVTITCDHLLTVTDDGSQPALMEAELIVFPGPATATALGASGQPSPGAVPDQEAKP